MIDDILEKLKPLAAVGNSPLQIAGIATEEPATRVRGISVYSEGEYCRIVCNAEGPTLEVIKTMVRAALEPAYTVTIKRLPPWDAIKFDGSDESLIHPAPKPSNEIVARPRYQEPESEAEEPTDVT